MHHSACADLSVLGLSSSPARKMFRFKSGDAESPRGGPAPDSPYSLSPVSRDHHIGASLLSPKRATRKIARSPFKVGPCPRAMLYVHFAQDL